MHNGAATFVFEDPRSWKRALTKLRRVNRRVYRSVRILRLDEMHKATTAIAKRSRLVCIESLHVPGWLQNRRLSRATAAASPTRFHSLLKRKRQREGVRLVGAGLFYPSSKMRAAKRRPGRSSRIRAGARRSCRPEQ